MQSLKAGNWLGIDVGSSRKKVCSFCLIESDGVGGLSVRFELGPADAPYPPRNHFDALIDATRAPTYLKEEVEKAVTSILDGSELVKHWRDSTWESLPSVVGIDSPVAFARAGTKRRLTEASASQSFNTPDRSTFESDLKANRRPGFHNSNTFWKCVGFTVYRWLAANLDRKSATDVSQETLAALTCSWSQTSWRVRETFPSDVYNRANGTTGNLSSRARQVLSKLVTAEWQPASTDARVPSKLTMARLQRLRAQLLSELASGGPPSSMRRYKNGRYGDLWDAFTCAFACCCEDHDAGELLGWPDKPDAQQRLRSEGAILTIRR